MKNNIIINSYNVDKTHHSVIACDKEKQLLYLLQGHNICPEILDCNGNNIVISLIKGNTLSEIIDSNNNLTDIFEKVADFITQFNSLTNNIVLDDINLKNFILSENRIYGIDFEKWHYGDNSDNYAAAMAMIKMARFETGQDKDNLCRHIEKYITEKAGYEKIAFRKAVDIFIEKTALRRKAMKKIRQCDCVIIAGGKSSRMGSPKGLLDYNGYTFIDHIIYNTAVFDIQYISANDNA
ncbi:MAG: NTP transferase domain-containing protein, partial [Oscillospiraceae bacterium]|nr:NTP transferase domain-containing protein [Oscillospiraceae bacterium]